MTQTLDRALLGSMIFEEEFSSTIAWGTKWQNGFPWGGTSLNSICLADSDQSLCVYDPSMVSVAGGLCSLSAAVKPNKWGLPWMAGMLRSVQAFGVNTYVEVCAKFPKGAGLHSTIWLLGPDAAYKVLNEIDIAEVLGGAAPSHAIDGKPYDPTFTLYTTHFGPGETSHQSAGIRRLDTSAQLVNHGLLRTPTTLQFYQNDILTATLPAPADMQEPMQLLITLQIGGNWAGKPSGNAAALQIDHVRAYALKP